MRFTPVTRLAVFYAPREGRRLRVGRLLRHEREILFEYDAVFLAAGLELSPFKMPARPGVFRGAPERFDGLPGLFDDSLPDGWGRLLIDRRARTLGLTPAQFGPLDRLSLVGSRAMGALAYEPEQALEVPTVVELRELHEEISELYANRKSARLDRLFAFGGSPHGARPKALVQLDGQGMLHAGVSAALPGCSAWMVKFPARDDPADSGALEHAWMLMVIVPIWDSRQHPRIATALLQRHSHMRRQPANCLKGVDRVITRNSNPRCAPRTRGTRRRCRRESWAA